MEAKIAGSKANMSKHGGRLQVALTSESKNSLTPFAVTQHRVLGLVAASVVVLALGWTPNRSSAIFAEAGSARHSHRASPSRNLDLLKDEKSTTIKPIRWRIASIPEAAYCAPAHMAAEKDKPITFPQVTALFDGSNLVVSGRFQPLSGISKVERYQPATFWKPNQPIPAKTTITLSQDQLKHPAELEISGDDGVGAGILRFEYDWRGLTYGPVSGWKYELVGESIILVDSDLNGRATRDDKLMYDGYAYWMPWHTVTCDGKNQYYEMQLSEDGTLATKTNPLHKPGKNADLLHQWNLVRKSAGVPPLVLDSTLESICQKHADYLKRNKITGHNEDPKLPGFSEQGRSAGLSSSVTYADLGDNTNAIYELFGSLYHRHELLNPREPIAMMGGNDYAYLTGFPGRYPEIKTQLPTEKRFLDYPQLSPAPQSQIGRGDAETENPPTLAKPASDQLGYSVWIRLPGWGSDTPVTRIQNVAGTLLAMPSSDAPDSEGKPVDCFLSYPGFQTPEGHAHNFGLIALTPLSPLKSGTYQARVKFRYRDSDVNLVWRFSVSLEKK